MAAVDLARQTVFFLDDEQFVQTARPGFRRRVVTGDCLQLCFWRIAGGTPGSYLHQHPDHEQLGIVVRGALDFHIGDENDLPADQQRVRLGPGDSYLAYRGVWHGDSVFVGDEEYNECWILDVFAPPRDDLLSAAAPATEAVRAPSGTDG